MKRKVSIEELSEWLSFMDRVVESEHPVILVEGSNDRRALKELGIEGNIMFVSQFSYRIKREGGAWIKGSSFIIMTDFDEEGWDLHDRIRDAIIRYGGRVLDSARNGYLEVGLPVHIEEAPSYLDGRLPGWRELRELSLLGSCSRPKYTPARKRRRS